MVSRKSDETDEQAEGYESRETQNAEKTFP